METLVKQKVRRHQKVPPKTLPILPRTCPLTAELYVRLKNLGSELKWQLEDEEIEYIRKMFNYKVVPYNYKISLPKIKSLKNQPEIIKKLIRKKRETKKQKVKNVNGKNKNTPKYLYCTLKHSDITALIEANIEFKPFKYVITKS